MFTGIVEEIGTIKRATRKNNGIVLTIEANKITDGINVAESIAIDGVCFTVMKKEKKNFSVEVSPPTLKNTTFSKVKIGRKVNLERPLTLQKRLGGHIITGHTDCKGKILEKKGREEFFLKISYPSNFYPYLIEKGSIAVDGISLTIQNFDEKTFQTFIISHTASNTILGEKREGEEVNIEFDFLIKIFYKYLKEKNSLTNFYSKLEEAGFIKTLDTGRK